MTLTSHALSAAGFAHGFTTREEGDFARGRDLPRTPVYLLEQVHGIVVRAVTPADSIQALAHERGDAVVTRTTSTVGVRTADCVPLLLADPESGAVAAVHAGWRGLAAGIAREALRELGSPSRVLVALGPSIGACCFEVDLPVARIIAASSNDICMHPARDSSKRDTHAQVDLRAALEIQLAALGVAPGRIERVGGCSRCDPVGFHSYRRDGATSGRMLSFVTGR
jgi:YfiH family protein